MSESESLSQSVTTSNFVYYSCITYYKIRYSTFIPGPLRLLGSTSPVAELYPTTDLIGNLHSRSEERTRYVSTIRFRSRSTREGDAGILMRCYNESATLSPSSTASMTHGGSVRVVARPDLSPDVPRSSSAGTIDIIIDESSK